MSCGADNMYRNEDKNTPKTRPKPPVIIEEGSSSIGLPLLASLFLLTLILGLLIVQITKPANERLEEEVAAIRKECDAKGLIVIRDATNRFVCAPYPYK